MATKQPKWLTILAIASTLLLGGIASAQDFPTLKGDNNRSGHNNLPQTAGPGQANLRWWNPSSADSRFTTPMIIDNTDNGSYLPANPYGAFSNSFTGLTSDWLPSPNLAVASNQEATNPYIPITASGTNRVPDYVFSTTTNSAVGGPQWLAATGRAHIATWTFTPQVISAVPNLYALYVWLPTGPQFINGTETFPQQYFVYTISAGGRTMTDVVNTSLIGGGWVRLGNGGQGTNLVFPYDGINNITITLYNTIARDSNGNLTGAPGQVVYADAAMAIPQTGAYDATPVSAQLTTGGVSDGPTANRMYAADNCFSSGGIGNNSFTTVITGQLTAYSFPGGSPTVAGNPIWTYSPVQEQLAATSTFGAANGVLSGAGFGPDANATKGYLGDTPNTAIIAAATTGAVSYGPNLNTGTYLIYAYLPGNNVNETYGTGVEYDIFEGTTESKVFVNQGVAGGWVQIGTRRYANQQATANQAAELLRVVIKNSSNVATDVGLRAYADAIRFVGETSNQLSSTPVVATVNITGKGLTQVVVVADANGYIHCVDATGNADGTTTEYWSYPTTLGPKGVDPNNVSGKDLGAAPLASYNFSSALIQQVGANYYLYVANTNGRVYCINMAGNGDYGNVNSVQKSVIGTTSRVWTYPSTAPGPNQNGLIGGFTGSVVYADPSGTGAEPTIYVPAVQGRMYALNALPGDGTDIANHTTKIRWQFPLATQPTLGGIIMTPAYAFGNLYFGTQYNLNTEANGVFYCLNAAGNTNGSTNVVWSYAGDLITPTLFDFQSSPTVIDDPDVSAALSPTDGIVYAMNENFYLYAFQASNGTVLWRSNELNTGAFGSLSFSWMSVYNNLGVYAQFPIVLVPTEDGRFDGLFADPAVTNQFGTRRAWEVPTFTGAPSYASMSVSNNWMFGADEGGLLYGFNNGSGFLSQGNPPTEPTITENNPNGAIFRNAKIALLTQPGYNLMTQATGQNLDYYTVLEPQYGFTRTPLAFEWGERVYIYVYNFPYLTVNGANQPVAPPIVNITFSSQGKTIRTITAQARLLKEPPNAPDDPDDPNFPNGTERDNGYAIYSWTFSSGVGQSLPPGPGNISVSISSSSLNNNGIQQNVALNPASSNFPFLMANPLAVAMNLINGQPDTTVSMGSSTSPSDPENIVNGCPKLPNTTKLENLLAQATPVAQHNSSQTASLWVIDRSMVGANNIDGTGLANVRVNVNNLARQGGHLSVYNLLTQPYYANFEDYPDNYPNTSLDYPDIMSEQITVVKDPNGSAENPRFNGVTLTAPLYLDPNTKVLRPIQLGDNPINRVLQPTLMNFTVSVPQFQPAATNPLVSAANALIPNSAGAFLNQGYAGRIQAFADSNGNGVLDTSPEEAYRGFNLFTSVDIDEQIAITTPTIDLGTLAEGTGYDPLIPGSNYNYNVAYPTTSTVFSPWAGTYSSVFQPFNAENLGNVNLLNLRMAKSSNFPVNGSGPIFSPWGFFSANNDNLAFLDGSTDLWSNIDTTFSPEGGGFNTRPVAFQKARVGDVAPTSLLVNPERRPNANLGTTGTTQIGALTFPDVLNRDLSASGTTLKYPPGPPVVGVSVPLGMPAGTYSNSIKMFEDTFGSQTWQIFNNAPETASDPTANLIFKVRESQLTSNFTNYTAPMADVLGYPNPTPLAPLGYSNMEPAMIRDPFGSLVVAWSSDRPDWTPALPTATGQLGGYSLFIASVGNSSTFSPGGITNTPDPLSPLSDLDNFAPANNGQWFRQAVSNYPNVAPNTLFATQGTTTNIIPGSVQYTNPSFPQAGAKNPFNPAQTFNGVFMAFDGKAINQTPNGQLSESRLFLSQVTLAGGGSVSIGAPVAMANDPQVTKGKASVVQTTNGAMVLYGGEGGGHSNIYYSDYNGTGFGPSVPLPFGSAFKSVSAPSASGRVYNGAGETEDINGVTTQTLAANNGLLELTFEGELRGRPNGDIYYGRMRVSDADVAVDDKGNPIDSAQSDGNLFLDLTQQTNEIVQAEHGQPGLFRTNGVDWDTSAIVQNSNPATTIQVTQLLNGQTINLLIGTPVYDRDTGLISYDSALGGKVFIDPQLGTIRFASTSPNLNAVLMATYTPKFIRVSAITGGAYARPTGMYDAREISNANYWRTPGGGFANLTQDIKNDRYVFTYDRAAAQSAGGLTARPYVSTARLGIQLPTPIATDNTGAPVAVTVTGATGPYQIDPANGRIYLTDIDEDRTIQVQYTAVNLGGAVGSLIIRAPVALVPEIAEQQIAIDNATDEADLSAFLDPFSFVGERRPPLIWLFWSSSRSGVPDIFFQTIAPQWSPVPPPSQ